MNYLLKACLYLALGLFAVSPGVAMTGEKPEFLKLADDVYAYVGKRNDANAMVIAPNQGFVLVARNGELAAPLQTGR